MDVDGCMSVWGCVMYKYSLSTMCNGTKWWRPQNNLTERYRCYSRYRYVIEISKSVVMNIKVVNMQTITVTE